MASDRTSTFEGDQEAKHWRLAIGEMNRGQSANHPIADPRRACNLPARGGMTNRQQTTLAAGALAIGAALLARGLRSKRRIEFHSRVVLITGGSRGLGLCLARQFGAEAARVAIAARNESELERAREELKTRGVD